MLSIDNRRIPLDLVKNLILWKHENYSCLIFKIEYLDIGSTVVNETSRKCEAKQLSTAHKVSIANSEVNDIIKVR